jgi:hypothetical protein
MTIVKRDVTYEEEKSNVVHTCDVCGLAEVDLDEGVAIDEVKSGYSKETRYYICTDEQEYEFTDIEEAKSFADETDESFNSSGDLYKRIFITWDLEIDVCTRCQNMMFGALRDDFNPQQIV